VTAPGGEAAGAVLAIAEQLGLALTPWQTQALQQHLALLQHWNAAYNLTAVRDPSAMRVQHLADCLAVVPGLRRWRPDGAARVLDVGSGGGLPGVVLAILFSQWDVTCVDTVGKKAAFVRQLAGALQLPQLHAVHGRVESLRAAPFDLITARAFASLADFVRLSRHVLASGGVWAAMKGQVPTEEMAALPADVEVFHVEQIQVPGLDAQRCLVWMRPTSTGQATSF
jgi:16S rRNA (guanine527-N7)-methyltransferase